jgi:hypothetical protein
LKAVPEEEQTFEGTDQHLASKLGHHRVEDDEEEEEDETDPFAVYARNSQKVGK